MFNYTLHLVYSIITGDNSNVCTVQDLYTELIPLFKSAGMSIGTHQTFIYEIDSDLGMWPPY